MRFIISRTSEWGDSSPCAEAKKDTIWVTEEDKCSSFEEYDRRHPDRTSWLSVGKNHRISSNGHIQRDVERLEWVIDINSIEDLLELSKKYGEIIISNQFCSSETAPCLEIYDDYRE
jgi:hypothetical protein